MRIRIVFPGRSIETTTATASVMPLAPTLLAGIVGIGHALDGSKDPEAPPKWWRVKPGYIQTEQGNRLLVDGFWGWAPTFATSAI